LGVYNIEEDSNEKEDDYVDNTDIADHYFEQGDCNCDCGIEEGGYNGKSDNIRKMKLMMSMKLR
jgi:hypothetical protein